MTTPALQLLLTVTNLNDSGEGSLRQAITDANAIRSFDTIEFDDSLIGSTVTLGGQMLISDSLNIDGDINDDGIPDITLNGNRKGRIFNITDNSSSADRIVLLEGLTLVGGRTDGGIRPSGGGIYSQENLIVKNSVVSDNSAAGRAGGIFNDGGDLTIVDSIISSNTTSGAFNSGGGIFTQGGTLTVVNSTISNNITTGLSSSGGGIANYSGNVTIVESTISRNTITGIDSNGGGIYHEGNLTDKTMTLTNVTIFGNTTASEGGGLFNSRGRTAINSSTLSGNIAAAGKGSGIASRGGDSTETSVRSSIISKNSNDDDVSVVSFVSDSISNTNSFVSRGSNLIGNGNAANGFSQSSDIRSTDPQLGPLQDNGGSTDTLALSLSSPGLNAGENADGLAADQRGPGFSRSVGQTDIGAFENQSGAPEINTPEVNDRFATIFVDESNTVLGSTFQSGQRFDGVLTSNTDGTIRPDDVIQGTTADDNIWGGRQGSDTIAGLAGNDSISFGSGDAFVDAGSGDDFVYGFGEFGRNSTVNLGSGNDSAYINGGNNLITGTGDNTIGLGGGNDTVVTSDGDDFVYTFPIPVNAFGVYGGVNNLNLGNGDNTVWVQQGQYTITTGSGQDILGLNESTGTVDAGDGNNVVYMLPGYSYGGANKHVLTGTGDDYIQTGRGDDLIDGGTGLNTLFGGEGANSFVIRAGAYNFIGDFKVGIDLLVLEDLSSLQLDFFQGTGDVIADAFIFAGTEAIAQIANTDVGLLKNSIFAAT